MSALQEVDHESADCFEIRRLHLYLFFQPSDRKYNGKKAETALSFLSGNDRCPFLPGKRNDSLPPDTSSGT